MEKKVATDPQIEPSTGLIINCDADPSCPHGLKIESHKQDGKFLWDPETIDLYLTQPQRDGSIKAGNGIYRELEGKPNLNANVLDFLLSNPNLIPESWQGKGIYFWGTMYRTNDTGYSLCVRSLLWAGDRWYGHYGLLEGGWSANEFAALHLHISP